jgi:hypothetical protein
LHHKLEEEKLLDQEVREEEDVEDKHWPERRMLMLQQHAAAIAQAQALLAAAGYY